MLVGLICEWHISSAPNSVSDNTASFQFYNLLQNGSADPTANASVTCGLDVAGVFFLKHCSQARQILYVYDFVIIAVVNSTTRYLMLSRYSICTHNCFILTQSSFTRTFQYSKGHCCNCQIFPSKYMMMCLSDTCCLKRRCESKN